MASYECFGNGPHLPATGVACYENVENGAIRHRHRSSSCRHLKTDRGKQTVVDEIRTQIRIAEKALMIALDRLDLYEHNSEIK